MNTIGIIIGIIIMLAMVVMITICLVIMYKDINTPIPYDHYGEVIVNYDKQVRELHKRIFKAKKYIRSIKYLTLTTKDGKFYYSTTAEKLINILDGKEEENE